MSSILKNDSASDEPAQASVLNLVDLAAEAQTAVLEARKDAARIVAQARQRAAEMEEQASQRGYEEGLSRGRNEGYADGRSEALAEARQQLAMESAALAELARKIIRELTAARADVAQQARRQALDFALEVAEAIVGHVALRDVAAAHANLQRILETAHLGGDILIKVNPGQLAALQSQCRELVASLNCGQVRLAADDRIGPGGVKLLSGQGEIDATIETQVRNVLEALQGPGREADQDRAASQAVAASDEPATGVYIADGVASRTAAIDAPSRSLADPQPQVRWPLQNLSHQAAVRVLANPPRQTKRTTAESVGSEEPGETHGRV